MLNKFSIPEIMGGKFCAILLACLIVALPLAHGAELEGGKDVNPEGDVSLFQQLIHRRLIKKSGL